MQEQVTLFLQKLSEKRYSEHTIAAYRNDLHQLLRFLQREVAPPPTTWQEVSAETVHAYIRYLQASNYSISTIARKIASMRSFFHHLVQQGTIPDDPTVTVASPSVRRRAPHVLSEQEIRRLLQAPARSDSPKALRDLALLHLLYATGMRVSEIIAVRVSDFAWDPPTLHFTDARGRSRTIPLPAEVAAALRDYLSRGRPHLLGRSEDNDTLFLSLQGRPLTRQGLWLTIKEYARAAGLGADVTPYAIRHSFAVHRLRAGATLEEIQAILGHTTKAATQIYAQLTEPEGRA